MLIEKRYSYEEIYDIINSLDLSSRILIGQYSEIVWHADMEIGKGNWYYEDRDYIAKSIYKIRNVFIPSLNNDSRTSLGIWNHETPEKAIKAYDIQQILRYQISWHRYPEGGFTVNFDNPFIHGDYKLDKDSMEKIRETVKDYMKTHFNSIDDKNVWFAPYVIRNVWLAPCVISEFDDPNEICTVLISNEIDDIIQLSLEITELIEQNQIKEVFHRLYPYIDTNLYYPQLTETENLLNDEEMKRYIEKKNK